MSKACWRSVRPIGLSASNRDDADIGGDTARLLLLANLSLCTANEEFCRRDVDTSDTVAIATDAGRLQTGGVDDAALLTGPAAFDRIESGATLLTNSATNSTDRAEWFERIAMVAFGATHRTSGGKTRFAVGSRFALLRKPGHTPHRGRPCILHNRFHRPRD